ncbi:Methyltransferase type 12 [Methylobacterium sp. 4-46]|uniref:class I SAM-dependent methyltransferase n=1 Tax=unclassified Methylobacterium TaxID=2615210 RepID=UPI000152BF15|nr:MULTISPECIES: class I SAM-dependent methyltransferase [Methylobacterium]ACA19289.1 Methyltransferase type 12 [Methylobacterium sp. 4-46]WFT78492.1 class I SAM-dependent methyltransferase [Methylobacterium nodulans]
MQTPGSGAASFFDEYVRRVFPARKAAAGADWAWPGDEWADAALREATWRRIVGTSDAAGWREVVEIGPGSGKYTEWVLARSPARVTAYEISAAFLDALRQRCGEAAARGRLDARLIDWTDNEGLLRDYGGRVGSADLWLAIDVLMMMDFQSALVYLISAAAMLRPGGRLVATFADGGSESGVERMLRDAGRHSAFDDSPCTRFHWIDRTLLERLLPRLGFGSLTIEHGPEGGLDIARLYLQAELTDPDAARALLPRLAPVGDSTNRRRD